LLIRYASGDARCLLRYGLLHDGAMPHARHAGAAADDSAASASARRRLMAFARYFRHTA